MSWFKLHRRSAWICGITLAIPVVLYLYFLFQLLGLRGGYQVEMNRIEPRIARMQGLSESEDTLKNAVAIISENNAAIAYPASSGRASISATMQAEFRELFSSAGLSVSNSQILPARDEGPFELIAIKFVLAGPLSSLDQAMTELSARSPLVVIESVEVWPGRLRRGKGPSQTLNINLQLFSLGVAQ